MAIFKPYTIHHLQFEGISTISLPQGNHYLVIWSGRSPLGHYWLEADKGPVSLGDYREELETILRPALERRGASRKPQGTSDKMVEGGEREPPGNRDVGLSVV